MDIPKYCSPQSHTALKKLARENRIRAGLRPRTTPYQRRTEVVYLPDGSVREKRYILHPTKGWRRA